MPLLLPTRRKASFSNSGYSGGGGNYPLGASHADVYRKSRPAGDRELIGQYVGVVYACINLNSHGVAKQQLRLYVSTKKGQKATQWATEKIAKTQLKAIAAAGKASGAVVRGTEQIEEVTDHPILQVLDIGQSAPAPDDVDAWDDIRPEMSGYNLIFMLQTYLELVGRAYLLVEKDGLGVPQKVWLLRSHLVREVPDFTGKRSIAYYEYGGANGIRYTTDQVVRFHNPDPNNPYLGGYSPTMSAIEKIRIYRKQDAHINAILDNAARPDAIWSPKGDTEGSSIGPVEAQRVRSAFRQAFAQAGQGGLLISEVPGSFQTLAWRPQDVVELERAKAIKTDICNTFEVPDAKLERNAANLASAKTADAAHAADAILHRSLNLASALRALVAMFDTSGRFFFAFDNPLPDDEAFALEQTRTGIDSGFLTVNEARAAIGETPIEGGDIRYVSSDLVAINPDNTLAPANMQPGSIKPAPGAQEPPQGAGEISSDASKSLSDVTGALLRVTKLFEGLLSHAKGTAAGQDDSGRAGAEGANGNGRHMLAYAKAQAEATTAEGEVKSSVDEPFRTVKYSPDEPRNAHGEWTDGGGEGEAEHATESVTAKPSKASEFDGDPTREAMREVAAKLNEAYGKIKTDAKGLGKGVAADINAEYARLQALHASTEEGKAMEHVVRSAKLLLDADEELPYADALKRAAEASPTDVKEAIKDVDFENFGDALELTTDEHPKASSTDVVKRFFAIDDAEAAIANVKSKLPSDAADAVTEFLGDDPWEPLSTNGELDRDQFSADAFEEWRDNKLSEAKDAVIASVPPHLRDYLDNHLGRIDDALEARGKIDADRVFAEDDNELRAIPHAAAEKFAQSITNAYADAVNERTVLAERVATRINGLVESGMDPEEAHATAFKELPKDDAEKVAGYKDGFLQEISDNEEIDTSNLEPEETGEIAEQVMKTTLKDAPKSVRARVKDEEDAIVDHLASFGSLDVDYFDLPEHPAAGAKFLRRRSPVSLAVRSRMKAAGYSEAEIVSRIVVRGGCSHVVMGLAPGDDVGWKKANLSGGHCS